MGAVTRHRGLTIAVLPGRWRFLGIRRLAVIDGGHQPISNEDDTVWAVCNGEIYNFRSLRRQLEQRGHRFRTASDTEVVVHAYEEYGEEFIEHLSGMFGVALWDVRRKRLLLGRDRFGIKPSWPSSLADSFSRPRPGDRVPGTTDADPSALRQYLGRYFRHRCAPSADAQAAAGIATPERRRLRQHRALLDAGDTGRRSPQ
jgi:asparagine synthase (glutamine-hydrolysing)